MAVVLESQPSPLPTVTVIPTRITFHGKELKTIAFKLVMVDYMRLIFFFFFVAITTKLGVSITLVMFLTLRWFVGPVNMRIDVVTWRRFRVTGPLWGESTEHRWIPLTKGQCRGLWCSPWCWFKQTIGQTVEMPVIWDAMTLIHCDASLMEVPLYNGFALYSVHEKARHILL